MGQRGQTASGTLQRSRALRCSGLGGYEPTAFTEEVLGTPRCDFGTVAGDKQGCPRGNLWTKAGVRDQVWRFPMRDPLGVTSVPAQSAAPPGRGQHDFPQSYLTAGRLSLGSQGPFEAGSLSGRRWRRLGRGGREREGSVQLGEPAAVCKPRARRDSSAQMQHCTSSELFFHAHSYSTLSCPKPFLAFAAPKLPLHPGAEAPISSE